MDTAYDLWIVSWCVKVNGKIKRYEIFNDQKDLYTDSLKLEPFCLFTKLGEL